MKPRLNTYTARYTSQDGSTYNETFTAYRIAEAKQMFKELRGNDPVAWRTVRINKNKRSW